MSSMASSSPSIVVFKNLPLESTVDDIAKVLKRLGCTYLSIDRKVDSTGEFRGTAFVRCATEDHATSLLSKVKISEALVHGRKVKAEQLKRSHSGKPISAKTVLEGGTVGIDDRAAFVRDIMTKFLYSDREEMMLPSSLDADQRKLAHAMAEKLNLVHATVSGNGASLNSASADGSRSVLITKHRGKSSASSSMRMLPPATREDTRTRSMASMMTAAATNRLAHIRPLLPMAQPEVPVFAAPIEESSRQGPILENMDQVAMMHAAKAQLHADAAKSALQAAKATKERGAMPAWLEIVEHKPNRGRSGSSLNANAPEFVPSASFMGPPPGLHH